MNAATKALKAAEEAYNKAVAKEALDKEIATANDLLGESATDADPGKALNDAITAAKVVSANADATVDELKAATETLKAAEEAFNTATGIESVKVDDLTKDGAVYNLNGVRVTNPTRQRVCISRTERNIWLNSIILNGNINKMIFYLIIFNSGLRDVSLKLNLEKLNSK